MCLIAEEKHATVNGFRLDSEGHCKGSDDSYAYANLSCRDPLQCIAVQGAVDFCGHVHGHVFKPAEVCSSRRGEDLLFGEKHAQPQSIGASTLLRVSRTEPSAKT